MNAKFFIRTVTLVFVALSLPSTAAGYSAEQTDWSGGWGVSGPVSEWGDTFDISYDINFYYASGKLVLAYDLLTEGERKNISTLDIASIVQSGDVDCDGDIDVIAAVYHSSLGKVVWYENLGNGAFVSTPNLIDNVQYPSYYSVDVDLDDDVDIILCSDYVSPNVFWYENDGTGHFTEHGIGSGYYNVDAPGCGDFDDDGDMDIVASARNGDIGGVRWYENDGSENFTEHVITSAPYFGQNEPFIPTGDIDGDDDVDFCLVRTNDHYVDWWENDLDGTGMFILHEIADGYTSPVHPWLADLDRDGDLDMVTSSSGLGTVDWWENEGGGNFGSSPHVIAPDYPNAQHFAVLDVDYDGDEDLITASAGDNALDWWQNVDEGDDFIQGRFQSDYAGACGCWADDVTGLGIPIALATAQVGDSVDWFQIIAGYRTSGELTSSILDIGDVSDYNQYWGEIEWTEDAPFNTDVTFCVRSSDDSADMREWSPAITESGAELSEYLEPNTRYFQYKVNLDTEGSDTPTLYDVTVHWYEAADTGVGEYDFDASPGVKGVVLTWDCDDGSVCGFNLYRSAESGGTRSTLRKAVNDETITGSPPYEFLDGNVSGGVTYSYWLEVLDAGGSVETVGPVMCEWNGSLPTAYALYPARPNPARGSAMIAFDLPEPSEVSLMVYDITGREVATLVNAKLAAGTHECTVSGLARGVYVYRFEAADYTAAKKMVVVE
jgi:hypothetical protein